MHVEPWHMGAATGKREGGAEAKSQTQLGGGRYTDTTAPCTAQSTLTFPKSQRRRVTLPERAKRHMPGHRKLGSVATRRRVGRESHTQQEREIFRLQIPTRSSCNCQALVTQAYSARTSTSTSESGRVRLPAESHGDTRDQHAMHRSGIPEKPGRSWPGSRLRRLALHAARQCGNICVLPCT